MLSLKLFSFKSKNGINIHHKNPINCYSLNNYGSHTNHFLPQTEKLNNNNNNLFFNNNNYFFSSLNSNYSQKTSNFAFYLNNNNNNNSNIYNSKKNGVSKEKTQTFGVKQQRSYAKDNIIDSDLLEELKYDIQNSEPITLSEVADLPTNKRKIKAERRKFEIKTTPIERSIKNKIKSKKIKEEKKRLKSGTSNGDSVNGEMNGEEKNDFIDHNIIDMMQFEDLTKSSDDKIDNHDDDNDDFNEEDWEDELLYENYHPQSDIGLNFREYPENSYDKTPPSQTSSETASSSPPPQFQSEQSEPVHEKSSKKRKGKYLLNEMNEMNEESELLSEEELKEIGSAKLEKKKFPHISRDYTKCRGCGIRLQSEREGELGYVPKGNKKKSKKKKRICQRCYYLRYYNKEPPMKSTEVSKILQEHSEVSQLLESTNNHLVQDHSLEQNQAPLSPVLSPTSNRLITPEIQSYQKAVEKDVYNYLKEILPSRKCVVIHLIDLSDQNPESFLANINKVVGTNPVHYVGTKYDLLPKNASLYRIRLWLHSIIESYIGQPVPISHVHVVSAISGQNVKNTILDIDKFRKGRDIFVVGCVNSGKSTFINSALLHLGIGGVKYDKRFGITTSKVPGTTLDAITLPLKTGGYLHDTPGLQIYNLIPSLTREEIKLLIPNTQIKSKILHIRQGKSVYLGGVGRLDYISGPAVYITVFVSRLMRIHIADTVDAENSQQKYVGKSLVPPILKLSEETPYTDYRLTGDALFTKLNENRNRKLPPYTSKVFTFDYNTIKSDTSAFADIVFPGIGWISLTGFPSFNLTFRALAMHPTGCFTRAPIMPYEATREGRRHLGVTRYNRLPSISIPYIKLPNTPRELQDGYVPPPPRNHGDNNDNNDHFIDDANDRDDDNYDRITEEEEERDIDDDDEEEYEEEEYDEEDHSNEEHADFSAHKTQ